MARSNISIFTKEGTGMHEDVEWSIEGDVLVVIDEGKCHCYPLYSVIYYRFPKGDEGDD